MLEVDSGDKNFFVNITQSMYAYSHKTFQQRVASKKLYYCQERKQVDLNELKMDFFYPNV